MPMIHSLTSMAFDIFTYFRITMICVYTPTLTHFNSSTKMMSSNVGVSEITRISREMVHVKQEGNPVQHSLASVDSNIWSLIPDVLFQLYLSMAQFWKKKSRWQLTQYHVNNKAYDVFTLKIFANIYCFFYKHGFCRFRNDDWDKCLGIITKVSIMFLGVRIGLSLK